MYPSIEVDHNIVMRWQFNQFNDGFFFVADISDDEVVPLRKGVKGDKKSKRFVVTMIFWNYIFDNGIDILP